MPNPYVNSNFPRIPGDYYPTIDPRCVYGFLEHVEPVGLCVDPCAPMGSGIVETLRECGFQAEGLPDANQDFAAEWVVCNPPYKRGLVDIIIQRQIDRIGEGMVSGVAMLLRCNFPFAPVHNPLFNHENYGGEIKLRFRPWWSADRSKQPIHNFSWHIWHVDPLRFYVPMFADGVKSNKVRETARQVRQMFDRYDLRPLPRPKNKIGKEFENGQSKRNKRNLGNC